MDMVKSFFELNSYRIFSCIPFHDTRRHETNEPRIDYFYPNHELSSNLRIHQMRQALPRRSTFQDILNSQPILRYVFRPAHLPGKLARYRSVASLRCVTNYTTWEFEVPSSAALADANEQRDWRIYTDFAQILIKIARPLYA